MENEEISKLRYEVESLRAEFTRLMETITVLAEGSGSLNVEFVKQAGLELYLRWKLECQVRALSEQVTAIAGHLECDLDQMAAEYNHRWKELL